MGGNNRKYGRSNSKGKAKSKSKSKGNPKSKSKSKPNPNRRPPPPPLGPSYTFIHSLPLPLSIANLQPTHYMDAVGLGEGRARRCWNGLVRAVVDLEDGGSEGKDDGDEGEEEVVVMVEDDDEIEEQEDLFDEITSIPNPNTNAANKRKSTITTINNGRGTKRRKSNTGAPTTTTNISSTSRSPPLEHDSIEADDDNNEWEDHPEQDQQGHPYQGEKQQRQQGNQQQLDWLCTEKNCKKNILCLNWLGANEWLDPSPPKTSSSKNTDPPTASKALNLFLKLQGLDVDDDPSGEMREVGGGGVGLRNLGATCYANAFIQVWFRILPFREAVYACAGDPAISDSSPVFQLALTFAALQNSAKSSYDPTGLVEALKLEKGNQQDASEFSKLFMTLLQAEFKKQQDERVKNVVSSEFEGKLTYQTKCLTCDRVSEKYENYLELEIPMDDTKNTKGKKGDKESSCILREALSKTLEPEYLCEDNQYYCTNCDSLQDAERRTIISTLPPTLHFSLLRFVFDPKLMDRKKVPTKIHFPPKIEMGEYLNLGRKVVGGGEAEREEVWYELKGLIEHTGATAHHGHFTAKVYDDESKQWVECDDESVSNIKAMSNLSGEKDGSDKDVIDVDGDEDMDKNAQPEIIDVDKEDAKKPKSKGKANGNKGKLNFVPGSASNKPASKSSNKPVSKAESNGKGKASNGKGVPGKNDHASKQAYMLVYELASTAAAGGEDERHTTVPQAGDKIHKMIMAENAAWEQDGQKFDDTKTALKLKFENLKAKKLEIMESWNIDSDQDGVFVPTSALVDWIKRGLYEKPKPKAKAASKRVLSLSPAPPEKDGAEKANGNGEANGQHDENKADGNESTVAINGDGGNSDASPDEATEDQDIIMQSVDEPSSSDSKNGLCNGQKDNGMEVDEGEHIAAKEDVLESSKENGSTGKKPSRKARQPFDPLDLSINASVLECSHGQLDPDKADDMKFISTAALDRMVELGLKVNRIFKKATICGTCILDKGNQMLDNDNHVDTAKQADLIMKEDNEPISATEGFLMSAAWWLEYKKRGWPASKHTVTDDEFENYRDAITCAHGRAKLPEHRNKSDCKVITAEVQAMIIVDDPDAVVLDIEPACEDCEHEEAALLNDKEHECEQAEYEARALSFLSDRTLGNPIHHGEINHVINRDFVDAWKRYIHDPVHQPHPEFDIGDLVCEHGLCAIDFGYNPDMNSQAFVTVLPNLWKKLVAVYPIEEQHILWGKQEEGRSTRFAPVHANRDFCKPCWAVRQTGSREVIRIRIETWTAAPPSTGSGDGLTTEKAAAKDTGVIESSDDEGKSKKCTRRKSADKGKGKAAKTSSDSFEKLESASNPPPVGRRSARIAKKATQKQLVLEVKKSATVIEVKKLIEDKWDIAAYYQCLFFGDLELVDGSTRIENAGIIFDSILKVKDCSADDIIDVDDDAPARPGKTSKERGNGGFHNTLLHGFQMEISSSGSESEPVHEPVPHVPAVEDGEEVKACPSCTFLNPMALFACTVCETPFP